MDVLALISVSNLSSNLVYCNLSVWSGIGDLISSKFINFSRGTNVLVDFYSNTEDYSGEIDFETGSYEVFNVSISGCVDYEILNKSYDKEPIHLDAHPTSILYKALFHNLNDLLSDDYLRTLNLSSIPVVLSEHDAFKISKRTSHQKKTSIKNLIAPSNDIQNSSGEDFFNLMVSSHAEHLHTKADSNRTEMCEFPAVHKLELFQSVIDTFIFVLSLCFLYWVSKFVKKLGVVRQCHDMRCTATALTGQKIPSNSLMHKLSILLPSDDAESIKTGDSSIEAQILNTTLRIASVEKEYYSMIESASENMATDCTAWECDTTESESDSPSIDGMLKDIAPELNAKINVLSVSSSSNTSSGYAMHSVVCSPNLNFAEDAFVDNGHCIAIAGWNDQYQIYPLPDELDIKQESYLPVSVDSIELAFLAGTR